MDSLESYYVTSYSKCCLLKTILTIIMYFGLRAFNDKKIYIIMYFCQYKVIVVITI